MNKLTPSALNIAKRLIATEANKIKHSDAEITILVFEKLRISLGRLIGAAGYEAMLKRALMLAKSDIDWLTPVLASKIGILEGFMEAASQQPDESATEGSVTLLAHFIALNITFVGERLTLIHLQHIWQGFSLQVEKSIVEDLAL